MAETRLRIGKQLAKSTTAGSIMTTDASNEAQWSAPTAGADRIWFYDDSAAQTVLLTLGTNLSITGTTINASAGAGGYAEVQEEGSALTARTKLNFVGAGFTAADDAGNTRTNVTLDATLNALAAYNTNGILTQTAADTFTGRTVTGTSAEITVTNGDGVSGNPTISLPTAITLTGKTLTAGTFSFPTITVSDNAFTMKDNTDSTKQMVFELSGITTATTRTLTVPDASGTIALTSNLSSYQPLDATLTALASFNTNGILTQTAADTFTGRTITGTTNRISVTNGDGVSGNPTIDIHSSYVGQTSITTLGTITTGTWNGTAVGATYGGTAQTTWTTGDMLYASASNTLSKLGIGTAGYILRVSAGGIPEWASTLDLGFKTKNSVRVATTAAGTLATSFANGQSVDSITLATGDRILIKNQSTASENGIYTVNASGAPTRALDADSWTELVSAYVWVEVGTTNADTGWLCTVDAGGTLNTTSVTWAQQSGAATITAGAGLTKTGNTIDVVAADTSITVNADSIRVGLNATASGLEVSSGIRIKSDTVTAGTAGITITSSGAGVKYDTNSFTDTSETLALAAGVAGSGLALTTGVLSVNVDASTIEINTDTLRVKDAGITYAKIQSLTQAALLGRSSAGVVQEITMGSGLTLSGTTLAVSNPISVSRVFIEGSTASSIDLDANTGVVKDKDGNNVAFTIPTNTDAMFVYRNGQRLNITGSITTRDYSLNTGTNTITLTVALATDEVLMIEKIV